MIKRFNQLILLSVLLFSCGWGPTDFIPTQQQITNLAWSPDGQKLAFMYENDKETNHNISFYRSSLYVINVDGTGLKRVQLNPESSSPYYLHQWAPYPEIITGGSLNIYSVKLNDQEAQQILLNLNKDQNQDYFGHTCILNGNLNILASSQMNIRLGSLNKNTGSSFDKLKFLSWEDGTPANQRLNMTNPFACSPYKNQIYFSGILSKSDSNYQHFIAELDSETGTIAQPIVFKSISFDKDNPQEQGHLHEVTFLGWKNEHTIVYFQRSDTAIYEFDLAKKIVSLRSDISQPILTALKKPLYKAVFSPDFKKVAYTQQDTINPINTQLIISNPDGTQAKSLLFVMSDLPNKDVP